MRGGHQSRESAKIAAPEVNHVQSLDELDAHPELARELPPDVLRDLYVRVHHLDGLLLSRLLGGSTSGDQEGHDTLIDVVEASRRLGKIGRDGQPSTDWIYRHAKNLPFTVRNGRQLRVSERALDRYIEEQRRRTKLRG